MDSQLDARDPTPTSAPRPTMTTPDAYLWTTRGWTGLKPAAWSLFLGILFGPGAIFIGIFGHRMLRHQVVADSSDLITIAERCFIVLFGVAGTLYLIATIVRLMSRYTITYDHRELRYTRTCLGITRQRIIQTADIIGAEAFLGADGDDDRSAYLRICLNAQGDDGLRLFMGSFPAATGLAGIISLDRGSG